LDVANSALKVLETEGAARSAAGGGVGPQSVPDPAKVPSIIGKLPDADLANGMIGSPAGLAKAAAKTSSRPRRGPKTDYQTALRVAEIANRIAGTRISATNWTRRESLAQKPGRPKVIEVGPPARSVIW
jgi:hypothetical protein